VIRIIALVAETIRLDGNGTTTGPRLRGLRALPAGVARLDVSFSLRDRQSYHHGCSGGEAVMSAVVYLRSRFEERAKIRALMGPSIFSGGLATDRRGAVDHEGGDFHEGA
jgi:hypothetical protein